MYKKNSGQMHIYDYTLSSTFTLDPNNRWIKRAQQVPWDKAEEKYAHMFRKNGRPAKDIRVALGALLIKEYLQCSDQDVVQAIVENPYLQYFIGLKGFTNKPPFDASLMVWFRKRLSLKFMNELNEIMCSEAAMPDECRESAQNDDDDASSKPENESSTEITEESEIDDENEDLPKGGTLIVDATCAPANIKYPTDTGLLAEAIEKTDQMIDTLHEPNVGKTPRPRTYRQKSRKLYIGTKMSLKRHLIILSIGWI